MPRSLQIPVAEKTRGVTKTRRVITRAVAVMVASLCLAAAPRADADEERVAWIGFLANEATPESGPVLRQGLHDRGWVEGQNLKIWNRYAQGKLELFPGHAEELLRVGVHLIVAAGPSATEAARRATTTIPVVVATPDDPVANGLVASASRPGGNLTGVSLFVPELARRRLELLTHAVGRAGRVAVLWNPSNPTAALELKAMHAAARTLGVALVPVEFREDAEFGEALHRLKGEDARALVVLADTVTAPRRWRSSGSSQPARRRGSGRTRRRARRRRASTMTWRPVGASLSTRASLDSRPSSGWTARGSTAAWNGRATRSDASNSAGARPSAHVTRRLEALEPHSLRGFQTPEVVVLSAAVVGRLERGGGLTVALEHLGPDAGAADRPERLPVALELGLKLGRVARPGEEYEEQRQGPESLDHGSPPRGQRGTRGPGSAVY